MGGGDGCVAGLFIMSTVGKGRLGGCVVADICYGEICKDIITVINFLLCLLQGTMSLLEQQAQQYAALQQQQQQHQSPAQQQQHPQGQQQWQQGHNPWMWGQAGVSHAEGFPFEVLT